MMTVDKYTEEELAEKLDAEGGIGGMIYYGWPTLDELPDDIPERVRHAFAKIEEVLVDMRDIDEWVYDVLDS